VEDRTVNARLRYAALLSTLAIAGCGGPTLDATSDETYAASTKKMTANMSDPQKRQFAQDVMAALGPEAAQKNMERTFSKEKVASSPTEMYKPLQGMTVEQIEAKAAENRANKKAK
jgi:hypothetical protein